MRKGATGFTLIELLIVVVIIGLLAGIALPKFGSTKGKATVAAMKSDLRNLATAQEAYWNDNKVYYGGAVPGGDLIYSPTPTTSITITDATPSAWAATASSPSTTVICAVFFGSSSPPAPATVDGVIACQ